MNKEWNLIVGGKDSGPFTRDEVIGKLQRKEVSPFFYAYKKGNDPKLISQTPEFTNWETITIQENPQPSQTMGNNQQSNNSGYNQNNNQSNNQNNNQNSPFSPSSMNGQSVKPTNCHEIDYRIVGEEMQYVEIELDPRETVVAEAGAMMYMTDQIEMETIFGDGSQQDETRGFFGRVLEAGKRVVTGESLFMTAFSNVGNGKRRAAFASPYPGKIIPVELNKFNGKLICQKDAFLCAAKGVAIGIEINRNLGTGLFGGEGFLMQKLEGDGLAFIHACGTVSEIKLAAGEKLKVDTGCLVAFTKDVTYDIEFVRGIKSMFFGGEGMCFARLTGPGSVWVQSLPFSRLASRVLAGATTNKKGEGSVLGNFGSMLSGDNRF